MTDLINRTKSMIRWSTSGKCIHKDFNRCKIINNQSAIPSFFSEITDQSHFFSYFIKCAIRNEMREKLLFFIWWVKTTPTKINFFSSFSDRLAIAVLTQNITIEGRRKKKIRYAISRLLSVIKIILFPFLVLVSIFRVLLSFFCDIFLSNVILK